MSSAGLQGGVALAYEASAKEAEPRPEPRVNRPPAGPDLASGPPGSATGSAHKARPYRLSSSCIAVPRVRANADAVRRPASAKAPARHGDPALHPTASFRLLRPDSSHAPAAGQRNRCASFHPATTPASAATPLRTIAVPIPMRMPMIQPKPLPRIAPADVHSLFMTGWCFPQSRGGRSEDPRFKRALAGAAGTFCFNCATCKSPAYPLGSARVLWHSCPDRRRLTTGRQIPHISATSRRPGVLCA